VFFIDVGSIGDVFYTDIFKIPTDLEDDPAVAFVVEMVSNYLSFLASLGSMNCKLCGGKIRKAIFLSF
jgi:hypothetical protein